jgi:hypothetical protein
MSDRSTRRRGGARVKSTSVRRRNAHHHVSQKRVFITISGRRRRVYATQERTRRYYYNTYKKSGTRRTITRNYLSAAEAGEEVVNVVTVGGSEYQIQVNPGDTVIDFADAVERETGQTGLLHKKAAETPCYHPKLDAIVPSWPADAEPVVLNVGTSTKLPFYDVGPRDFPGMVVFHPDTPMRLYAGADWVLEPREDWEWRGPRRTRGGGLGGSGDEGDLVAVHFADRPYLAFGVISDYERTNNQGLEDFDTVAPRVSFTRETQDIGERFRVREIIFRQRHGDAQQWRMGADRRRLGTQAAETLRRRLSQQAQNDLHNVAAEGELRPFVPRWSNADPNERLASGTGQLYGEAAIEVYNIPLASMRWIMTADEVVLTTPPHPQQ